MPHLSPALVQEAVIHSSFGLGRRRPKGHEVEG